MSTCSVDGPTSTSNSDSESEAKCVRASAQSNMKSGIGDRGLGPSGGSEIRHRPTQCTPADLLTRSRASSMRRIVILVTASGRLIPADAGPGDRDPASSVASSCKKVT